MLEVRRSAGARRIGRVGRSVGEVGGSAPLLSPPSIFWIPVGEALPTMAQGAGKPWRTASDAPPNYTKRKEMGFRRIWRSN